MGTGSGVQLKMIQNAVKILSELSEYSEDQAIRRVTNGRFRTWRAAADAMRIEFEKYYETHNKVELRKNQQYVGNGYDALKAVCGIDLKNDDTGAITGVDAGNAVKKAAKDVVVDASPKTLAWPDGKTAVRGVVFHVAAQKNLSKAQQDIVKDIYNRWANGALASIEQALGVTFASQAKTKDITISFATPKVRSITTEDYNKRIFSSAYVDGKMVLYVNLKNRTISEHTNGKIYNSATKKYETYADRTLTQELARLMTYSYNYHGFSYVRTKHYGLVELITGADDVLKDELLSLGKQMHKANGILFDFFNECNEGSRTDSEVAAYSYMIWRYMANYMAGHASGPELYSADGTKVTLTNSFSGTYNLDEVNTVRVVDASNTTADITISDACGTNNTYYLGKGKTIINTYGGKDTYYGFKSDKDVVMFREGTDVAHISRAYDVKDVILYYGDNYEVRIKDAVGKKIRMMRADNRTQWWSLNVPKKVAPPLGTGYKPNSKETVLLSSDTFSGTVDGRLYTQVSTFDLRGSKKATTVRGNGKANTIYASAGGSKIYGLGGNDTLVGGDGKDTFYFGTADGTDTIKNFNESQDVIRLTSGKYTAAQFKSHVTLNKANGEVNITNGKTKVRIVDGIGQNIKVYDAAGKIVYNAPLRDNNPTLNKKTGTVTLNKNYTGTMDLRNKNYASMSKINAASATHKVTLYGNGKNNTLTASKGGSILRGFGGTDTLVGNSGVDTFYAGKGEGSTIIKNYQENRDILKLAPGTKGLGSMSFDGNDFVFKYSDGSQARIVDAVGKNVQITDAQGKTDHYYYSLTSAPRNTTYTCAGKTTTGWEAQPTFGGMMDARKVPITVTQIHADASKNKVDIVGNRYSSSSIYASQGGGVIYSMSGNDKIYCNNGVDTIVFGHNYGQDTVYKSRKNDIAYLFEVTNIKQVKGAFSKGVMKLSFTDGSKDVLSIAGWSANSSMNMVMLKNKQKYRINAKGEFTLVK